MSSNINNGIMTNVWGPAGWLFFHCITFGYPMNPDIYDYNNGLAPGTTKKNYQIFFEYLGTILPCKYCRESYIIYYNKDPVSNHLNTRDSLIKWFWNIHNKVNNKLGTSYCDSNIETIKKTYESYRAKCSSTTETQRNENKEKGCITPVDGKPKKCVITVISNNKTMLKNNRFIKGFLSGSLLVILIGIIISFIIRYN